MLSSAKLQTSDFAKAKKSFTKILKRREPTIDP